MKLTRRIGSLLKRSGEWIGGIGTSSGYSAGSGSGRWHPGGYLPAPVSQTHAASAIVSHRAAFMVGSNPLAASLADVQVSAEIHDGPSVRSAHPDEAMRSALETGFADWQARACVDGRDLTALACGMSRSRFIDGEAVTIMRTDRNAQLILQQVPAAQLDRNTNRELDDGARIIGGVETDASDQRTGYWVWPDQPDLAFSSIGPPVRLAADDVLHLFQVRHPGQRRGISELAPVMPRLHDLEKLLDALGARAGTAALFGGFITDASGIAFGDATKPPDSELSLEPGAMRMLPPGADIKFPAMPDMADAPSLLKHMQRDIASGCGIPFELACGDLSTVNYSSAKLGLEAYKRRIKALRASLLVPRFYEPIWKRWVMLEILSGRLHAPDFEYDPEPYFRVSFLFPEWAALDPLKDCQADVLALSAGLRSRAEIIAARGRDIADVDREIAADTFKQPAPNAPAQDLQNAAA